MNFTLAIEKFRKISLWYPFTGLKTRTTIRTRIEAKRFLKSHLITTGENGAWTLPRSNQRCATLKVLYLAWKLTWNKNRKAKWDKNEDKRWWYKMIKFKFSRKKWSFSFHWIGQKSSKSMLQLGMNFGHTYSILACRVHDISDFEIISGISCAHFWDLAVVRIGIEWLGFRMKTIRAAKLRYFILLLLWNCRRSTFFPSIWYVTKLFHFHMVLRANVVSSG